MNIDPDEVFQQHKKTCSLDEVFNKAGMRRAQLISWVRLCLLGCCHGVLHHQRAFHAAMCWAEGHARHRADAEKPRDFSRRTSSGNWIQDRVTWKEELSYKRAMGYI